MCGGFGANWVVFDEDKWDSILSLADQSVVNTIVFDTKDESGQVLYDTTVALAQEIGAVHVFYDPVDRIAEARAHDLYTITRIVTFEDNLWANSGEAQVIGAWVDARNQDNWEYPIALAVEACGLGFDEVQFDYIRFPAGSAGGALNRREGLTEEIRVAAIESFLEEARAAINPLGCAVSADVFAIVMSTPDDQGIGQKPEGLSRHLDAISPMIYPSHYGNGWLGFDDPNEHNAEVTADALDDGAPRLTNPALMRPWLQAFYYNASEILEGINEAEKRGFGWMLWNVNGNYDPGGASAIGGRDNRYHGGLRRRLARSRAEAAVAMRSAGRASARGDRLPIDRLVDVDRPMDLPHRVLETVSTVEQDCPVVPPDQPSVKSRPIPSKCCRGPRGT